MLRFSRKSWVGILSVAAALTVTLIPASAWASINLTQVQMTEDGRVDVMFDTKIAAGQIKTEYVNDNIQLSLSGVSVYPAKINSVSGTDLTKIFAYQYAPNLVRLRLTVKGKAQDFERRVSVKTTGKLVSIRILPADGIVAAPRKASAPEASVVTEASSAAALSTASLSGEEKQLLDRVVNSEKADKKEAKSDSDRGDRGARATKAKAQDSKALTTGRPVASPMRSIGVMLFVLGLFGLFVFGLKKLKGSKDAKGIAGFLGKLGGNLGNKKLIDVVATHHLGPKKSIVMVRIQDRMLVLGMTNDNVNLITEFRSGEGDDEAVDMSEFAEGLRKFESVDPAATPPASAKPAKKDAFGPLLGAMLSRPSTDEAPSAPRGPRIDLDAISASLATPKARGTGPSTPVQARSAASAYLSAGSSAPSAPAGSSSPAFDQVMKTESSTSNLRAQIKNRMQGMKQL